MNQRFTNSVLLRELVHPRTGLVAIGVGKRGPIWPVMGGAPDDGDGTDSNSDSDGDGKSGNKNDGSGDDSGAKDSSEDGGKDKGSKGKKQDSDSNDDTVYTADEYKGLMARMQAADRNNSQLQKKLKDLQDKDKPADQKLQEEAAEAKQLVEKLQDETKQMRIQLAFLKSNEVQWHDPEDALAFIDFTGIQIDDDGNVDNKALKAALKDLAKRKPHLVKTAKKQDDGDGDDGDADDDSKNGDQGSSGNSMAGKRKGSSNKDKLTRQQLAKDFPALRRR